ncbi:hypothetical protein BHM03_00062386, partial [Ensete ventricosum]
LFPYPHCGVVVVATQRRRRRGQSPLRQALLPSGGTSQGGGAALHGRCPCWQSLLPMVAFVGSSPSRGAALAASQQAATPCGLATAAAYARRRQPCPRAVAPASRCPLRAGCPFLSGY